MATTSNPANMDVPIRKIDIEYLIDAAEKTFCVEGIAKYISYKFFGTKDLKSRIDKLTYGIFETSETDAAARTYTENQRYISYILFKEAQEKGTTVCTEELESRIDKGLKRLTKGDIYIPVCPEDYRDKSIIQVLVQFYRKYNEDNRIDEIRQEDEKHKKWGILGPNFQKLERRYAMRERILTTSKALRTALKMLTRVEVERGDISEEVFIRENGIPVEFLQDTEYDEEGSNETYNIIPFDGLTDRLPAEVKEAIDSLKWDIEAESSPTRGRDVLDCLQKFFGFQESSVSNQRENIVNLLSNELMRLGTPGERETAFKDALENVFSKTLDNYTKWCSYLSIDPIWENTDVRAINKEKKILYICLYYLIWGEAANVRFLPECLCYIFHRMSEQLDDGCFKQMCEPLDVQHVSGSFIDQVIQPLYEVIAAEAKINNKKDAPHSKWRNYDDFNEYFWSKDCLELSWPLNGSDSPFFSPPEGSTTVFGKTSFIERRTFLHLYHSFHRMWIFHVMMFQALVIIAFNDAKPNSKTLREILTVGTPTYLLMKLIQSMLDIWLKYGAYSKISYVDVIRIVFRFIRFNQEEYVGHGMDEDPTDYNKYRRFWIVTLAFNIAYTYYFLIRPLVRATRDITDVSKNIHNMLAIGSLWAGVICAYIVGSHVVYNAASAVVGTFVGHRDGLGKIKSLGDVHKCFDGVPKKFMAHLHTPLKISESPPENNQQKVKKKGKLDAEGFSPFWNQIVMHLREEDYISDLEQDALNMPEKSGCIDVVQWPLFLLVGKVFIAIRMLQILQQFIQSRQRYREWERLLHRVQQLTQSSWREVCERLVPKVQQLTLKDLWNEISKDDVYMKYAVVECFHSVKFILHSVLKDEGKKWVEGIYEDIESSIAGDGKLCPEFQLDELERFVKAISELTEILNIQEDADNRLIHSAEQALQNVIRHDFLGNKRFPWLNISVIWPEDPELRSQIKRLHFLLATKSAAHVPRNREARRRLEFYTNSLFMSMPKPKPVRKMLSFSVLTPYYEETVLYSLDELESSNDDGVTLIDYLKNLYPDEWTNYCERIDTRYTDDDKERHEYRLWASYRGQTLARTVRGTMYYQKALLLQAYREMLIAVGLGVDGLPSTSPVPVVSMDEATLISLEERSPRGELLVQTSDLIILLDKESYHPWREQMMELLVSKNMKGFVDGSLRDPDPKGESQDANVCNYSQKWKKLDKIVKDWIMASLNDILKNMVKEMKTAKELWETLKMFFSTDTDEISSVNVTEHVSIKLLNKDHYRGWVSQMEKFLQEKGMIGYINGKLKDPDPEGKSQVQHVRVYSQRWKELDTQVKKWISASLSDSVKDSETAEQMWDALKEIIRSQCLDNAKAHVDLKFTYVVSCQKYGKQKRESEKVAADIAFLLKKNEGLRVAYIDENEENNKKEFYSKLVKADKNGKETEIYSIKLPGNPILGEGKPENQNHAIVFTRGNAIQTIDMNQDNYFEETLKMRNLLEEFHRKHVIRPPTILGIREHIFTGSASSLASFMSNQETGFVTLGQRVIANPLKVRMHYGHPDVFDRVFHITRGGISKASRGINISEDIYAGFNSTLRQGSVTHHEYIQVGKGRDVGFNQIATFEGKVAGGNGEQVLSRDIYRLGQRFDFFRMLSLYYTTVGYYFSSFLMVITLYILLYGNLIMALSGTRVPHLLNDIDMAPEWFLMIVLLPSIYMLLVPYLEHGLEKAVESFLAMFFSLGSIFFAFSLGTRIHWFGRTIIHGGASYQATGRGFVLHHIKFSENYRRYSRSHFVKGMEVLFLLVVYCIYGFHSVRAIYNNLLLLGGLILSVSWIVAPFLFDSSPFDLYIKREDWADWNNWRNFKSWEAWWNKELSHIRTTEGRVIETILSLRFFIFPLVVGYKLDVQGLGKSFSNCVIPWICLVVILFFYEVFYKKKQMIQFFSFTRMATIFILVIAYYSSAFGDVLTFTTAIITTILGFSLFFNVPVVSIARLARVAGAFAIAYYCSDLGMFVFIMAFITTIWGFILVFKSRVATIGVLAIACYYSDFGGTLAFIIAIITTIWGFISICVAWKPALEIFCLWTLVEFLAWICDTGMRLLLFTINACDDLSMLLLYLLVYVSEACEDWKPWKPTLKRFSLWTPVTYLAWICDSVMGALMFKIANMFSQRSIKQYLVRNMFDQNISELLHKSSTEREIPRHVADDIGGYA